MASWTRTDFIVHVLLVIHRRYHCVGLFLEWIVIERLCLRAIKPWASSINFLFFSSFISKMGWKWTISFDSKLKAFFPHILVALKLGCIFVIVVSYCQLDYNGDEVIWKSFLGTSGIIVSTYPQDLMIVFTSKSTFKDQIS